MEDALRKQRNQLEELIKKRTSELTGINLELKNEIQLRYQFETLLNFERKQLISIFDSIPGLIFVSDMETYKILYANKAMRNKYNKELIGGTCYIELQGKESPCEFCVNQIILQNNGKPYQHEYYNHHIGLELLVINKLIKWPDGRSVRFEFALDITKRKQMENELRSTIEELNIAKEEIRHNYEKCKYLSMHDSLTGLYNRAFFEEEMHRMNDGRNNPVCIIVCDVDGLKFINDTLGHSSGDEVLIAAAGVFKESFRSGDVVARIGGDEYAMVLSKSDHAAAEKACRRIKNTIKKYNSSNPKLPLNISIGFAININSTKPLIEVFKEADNNMYREKLHRNQSTRSTTVQTLTKMLQARDFITEGHTDRLQELVKYLRLFSWPFRKQDI